MPGGGSGKTMRARNLVIILIVAALIGLATPAVAQWSVSTVGGPPMAEELGVRNLLAVGVFCQNGSQTVTVILMGQRLQAGTVSARWNDGSSDNYSLQLGRDGRLTGTGQVAQAMIAKLRRLNSVTLRTTGPGSGVVEDTISLAGSSRAIGQINCGRQGAPRRASNTSAAELIGQHMTGVNPWRLSAADLVVVDNPNGAGEIVYIRQVQERLGQPVNLLWVVVAGRGYAVNGPSKNMTPELQWPREAPDRVWETTGLDKYSATDTIRLVFEQNN